MEGGKLTEMSPLTDSKLAGWDQRSGPRTAKISPLSVRARTGPATRSRIAPVSVSTSSSPRAPRASASPCVVTMRRATPAGTVTARSIRRLDHPSAGTTSEDVKPARSVRSPPWPAISMDSSRGSSCCRWAAATHSSRRSSNVRIRTSPTGSRSPRARSPWRRLRPRSAGCSSRRELRARGSLARRHWPAARRVRPHWRSVRMAGTHRRVAVSRLLPVRLGWRGVEANCRRNVSVTVRRSGPGRERAEHEQRGRDERRLAEPSDCDEGERRDPLAR